MSSWRISPRHTFLCAILSLLMAQVLNAAEITSAAFGRFAQADVVIVGELHDNDLHHANQARAIEALRPKAVVFEMLDPCGPGCDRDIEARIAAGLASWSNLEDYRPVFNAAEAVGAEIIGAALPFADVRRAVGEGAAQVFGRNADRFGLTNTLPEDEQTTREALQDAAHCNAMPPEMLPGMVEAQRLRDAGFTRATLQALEKYGAPVVVITGNGHARSDWGMARYFASATPELEVVSIGQVTADETAPPYDFWLVTPPVARADGDDPCAVFKSN